MPKKGFSTILIVVIVLVVVAGGALAWQYWPESTEQELPADNEVADWQTYRNEKYGFEVKYPKDWTVEEKPLSVYPDTFTVRVELKSPTKDEQLFIAVRPKTDAGMILEAYEVISDMDIDVGNITGSKITGVSQKDGSSKEVFVFVVKDEYLYNIYLPPFYQDEVFLEEVLSTFRFLESNVETMNLKVYFIDKQMMIEGTSDYKDMAKPVVRTVPKTQAVAKTAIEELLKGLMDNEKAIYSDSIPIGTKMNSISINNRIAYVDFSEELGSYGGGSATVNSIEWQIKKTLMQFSTVDSVVISIEGETEGILQP